MTDDRTCSDCPSRIGRRSKSGLCRACAARRSSVNPEAVARRRAALIRMNADPAVIERRRAGIRARFADPAYRAAHAARCAAANRNLSDAVRASRREHGKRKIAQLRAANQAMTPETRAANGRKRSETVLAWCPPEWRDKYRDIKTRGRRAADAKRIVLDLIAGKPEPVRWAKQKAVLAWCPPDRRAEYERARDVLGAAEARRVIEADLTPFERQLARVAAGARLIEVRPMRRADPAYTLAGIASYDG